MDTEKLVKIVEGTNNQKLLQEVFNKGYKSVKIAALMNINDLEFLEHILEFEESTYKYFVLIKIFKSLLGDDFDVLVFKDFFEKSFDNSIDISNIQELTNLDNNRIFDILYERYFKYRLEDYERLISGSIEYKLYNEYKKAVALFSRCYTKKFIVEDRISCLNFIRYIPDDFFFNMLSDEPKIFYNIHNMEIDELDVLFEKIDNVKNRITDMMFANIVTGLDNSRIYSVDKYIEYCILNISDKRLLKEVSISSVSWYTKLLALAKLEGRLED